MDETRGLVDSAPVAPRCQLHGSRWSSRTSIWLAAVVADKLFFLGVPFGDLTGARFGEQANHCVGNVTQHR